VFYFLQSQYDKINKSPRGIGIPHVDPNVFWNIEIPLPPLPEQERIVAKIEELFTQLDAGVAGLKRIQAALKHYKASVLKAACEGRLVPQDPSEEGTEEVLVRLGKSLKKIHDFPPLPSGWCFVSLGQFITSLKNGYFYSRPAIEPPGIPILRISAVRPMAVNFDEIRYAANLVENEVKEYFLSKGDLLFTRYNGNPNLVGACGLVDNISESVLYPDKLIRVRVEPKVVLPEYLEDYFATDTARRYVESLIKTTAGQYGIAGGDLKSIPVPVPPLAEQQRIANEVDRRLSVAQELEAAIAASLARAGRLRKAVLKRAFEGKLVEQNLENEPVKTLPEAINAADKTQEKATFKQARLF
jgi:type I restriction enzyme, S subunit